MATFPDYNTRALPTKDHWVQAVRRGDTVLGFMEWVAEVGRKRDLAVTLSMEEWQNILVHYLGDPVTPSGQKLYQILNTHGITHKRLDAHV